MSDITGRYNPQTVSPKAMQIVSLAVREGIVFKQQAYIPLDGAEISAIEEAEGITDDCNKIRARG